MQQVAPQKTISQQTTSAHFLLFIKNKTKRQQVVVTESKGKQRDPLISNRYFAFLPQGLKTVSMGVQKQ